MDRCYWVDDPILGHCFIPECIGGATNGPEGCTCDRALSAKEIRWKRKYRATEKRLRRAIAYLDWARARLDKAGIRSLPLVGEIKRSDLE